MSLHPAAGPFHRARAAGQDRAFVEKSEQIVFQGMSRFVTPARLFGQRVQNDCFEIPGNARDELPGRYRLGVHDLAEEQVAVAAFKDGTQHEQLVKAGPE